MNIKTLHASLLGPYPQNVRGLERTVLLYNW